MSLMLVVTVTNFELNCNFITNFLFLSETRYVVTDKNNMLLRPSL